VVNTFFAARGGRVVGSLDDQGALLLTSPKNGSLTDRELLPERIFRLPLMATVIYFPGAKAGKECLDTATLRVRVLVSFRLSVALVDVEHAALVEGFGPKALGNDLGRAVKVCIFPHSVSRVAYFHLRLRLYVCLPTRTVSRF
jgi:hypothetical protein